MNNEKKKVSIINVYLTYQDKKILNEIREKYHISYSCIAKVLLRCMMTNHDEKIGVLIWTDHYFYKDNNQYKTSIKPRLWEGEKEAWNCWLKEIQNNNSNITMLLTNMLKTFTRNEIGKYTGWEEKTVQKIRSRIYNQFQQEYDPNWNGNAFARQFSRFAKRNPAYTKKVLGIEDDR